MNFLKKIIIVLLFLFPISNSFGAMVTEVQNEIVEDGDSKTITGIVFNKDGTKMFTTYQSLDDGSNDPRFINEYTLSTPFDMEAVDYLNDLVPFFKIASADLTNLPLIKRICSKNKPIVLSTGASSMNEIQNSVKFINKISLNPRLVILHCILSYPTDYNQAHLEVIENLSKKFPKNVIGLSDHTLPDESLTVLTTAYYLGARVIEKHFSDVKGKKGNDHFHSLNAKDLKKFIRNVDIIRKIVQKQKGRKILNCEKIPRKNARRSIVTLGNIEKGDRFTENNLIMKRPGTGISPTKIKMILGKKAKRSLRDDQIIKFSDIKK